MILRKLKYYLFKANWKETITRISIKTSEYCKKLFERASRIESFIFQDEVKEY